MAASTKYILAAVAASKKIEYKNVEKFLYSIFLKKPQNSNGRVLNENTFCEHDIDFYENLSSDFYRALF